MDEKSRITWTGKIRKLSSYYIFIVATVNFEKIITEGGTGEVFNYEMISTGWLGG